MRKIADKVVLVAHISISAIFVLVTILMFVNIIPLTFDNGLLVIDGFVMALVMILAGIYLVLSAYLLYSVFAQRNVVKQVLLYADEYNETNATSTVIRKIANSSAKLVSGVKVKKLRITAGDKGKLHMRLTVSVDSDDVAYTIDTLRCLLVEHYSTVLSLTFDSIDFNITHIKSSNVPDLDKAQSKAEVLRAGRVVIQEITEQPIVEEGCIDPEVVVPQVEEAESTEVAEVPEDNIDALELLREQKRKDFEKQASTMYGTPEVSLVDDISVEITDDDEQSETETVELVSVEDEQPQPEEQISAVEEESVATTEQSEESQQPEVKVATNTSSSNKYKGKKKK